MLAKIDADSIVYKVGFMSEKEPLSAALTSLDNYITSILKKTEASDWEIYLTGTTGCLRTQEYPLYKANRKTEKPRYYVQLRDHLVSVWGAAIVSGIEADDMLSIDNDDNTLLCHIDKDINQVSGKHYNYVTEHFYTVSLEEASRAFWLQMLIGDTVDNIKGVPRVGSKKAPAILDSGVGYAAAVKYAYADYWGESWVEVYNTYGTLLQLAGCSWFTPVEEHPSSTKYRHEYDAPVSKKYMLSSEWDDYLCEAYTKAFELCAEKQEIDRVRRGTESIKREDLSDYLYSEYEAYVKKCASQKD